tara:strand:+ start:22264 stop:23244 length:981 start_codon:yes stop_codon:yes gene_type:complete
MITEIQYLELDIANIYYTNRTALRSGKIPSDIGDKFVGFLQDEISDKGQISYSSETYENGNDNDKKYYFKLHSDYKKVSDNYKDALNLEYFISLKGSYEYFQSIKIETTNANFPFWFALKLFTLEEDLTLIDKFLSFQKKHFESAAEYSNFLKPLLNQYNQKLFSNALVRTVEDWICIDEKRGDVGAKNHKPANIKKVICGSFLLKPLYTISDHQDRVSKVFQELKRNNFISKDSSINTFFHFLSNESITKNKRIKWIASNVTLRWFILNLLPYVEYVGKDHWHITIKCFVKSDSSEYTTEMLRKANSSKLGQHELLKSILLTFYK